MKKEYMFKRVMSILLLTLFIFQILPVGAVKNVYADTSSIKRGVDVDKTWKITFNKAVLNTSENLKLISMYDSNNNKIPLDYKVSSGGTIVEVKPSSNLRNGQTYNLKVQKGIKSKDGSKISKEENVIFKTVGTFSQSDSNRVTITIDAGQTFSSHVEAFGVKGSKVNLAVALKVGSILEEAGAKVIYTRKGDSVSWSPSEDEKNIVKIHENNKSDLFLSIRSNMYTEARVNGIETYSLNNRTQDQKIAESVQSTLIEKTGATNRGVKTKESDKILQEINSPGVLVHLGFISNEEEAKKLSSSSYQDTLAKSIAKGVLEHYGEEYDFEVDPTPDPDPNPNPNPDPDPDEKEYTVTINPSRVGTNHGIVASNGLTEKSVNLDVALKVGKILESNNINVVYTIKEDKVIWEDRTVEYKGQMIPLEIAERLKIANNSNSDLMVSIGGNSVSNPDARGIETYYYSGHKDGEKLAKSVQDNMIQKTGGTYRGFMENNGLNTLKLSESPSIWAAVGFFSNYDELQRLSNEEYRERLALGIAEGIIEYLEGNDSSGNDNTLVYDETYELAKGESFVLPTELSVDIDGTGNKTRRIVWENTNVDTSNVGVFTYKGKVEGTNKRVEITLIITQASTPGVYDKKVVIDPGHGGYDPGGVGPSDLREKDITLNVSLMVGDILLENGIEVVYTRTSDVVSWPNNELDDLKARVAISNREKPDAFVSIHVNKFYKESAHGIETFYYQGSATSEDLGRKIQSNLINATGRYDRGIKRGNGLYVIKHTDAPSVLVELPFISNPVEEKLLEDPAFQKKCAEAIAKGIIDHLKIR